MGVALMIRARRRGESSPRTLREVFQGRNGMSIVVRGLCKSFGSLRAVDNVSFEIPFGGIIGLIGPNGAGKSTILRILTTFLAPTSGEAQIGGFDCGAEPQLVRKQLGYLPESPPAHADARVRSEE